MSRIFLLDSSIVFFRLQLFIDSELRLRALKSEALKMKEAWDILDDAESKKNFIQEGRIQQSRRSEVHSPSSQIINDHSKYAHLFSSLA